MEINCHALIAVETLERIDNLLPTVQLFIAEML